MKFNKFLEKMPNFWAFSQIPAAVQEQVNNWFYYRDCCSNNVEKFNRFLSRKVSVVEPQFMALWKAQASLEFEPGTIEKIESTIDFSKEDAVVEAIQRIVSGTVADTGTTKNEQTVSATDTNTETRNLTNTETMTGTESREEDKTQTNNTVSATTKTGTDKTDTERTRTDDLTQLINESKDDTGTITNGGTTSRDSDVKRSDYPQSTPLGFENYISAEEQSEVTDTETHTETRDLTTTGTSTTKNTGTQGSVEETTVTHNTEDETTNTGTIKNAGTDTLTVDRTNSTTQGGTITNEADHDGTNNTTLTLDTKQESSSNDKTDRTNDIETKAKTVIETLRSGNFEEAFEKYFRMASTFNAVSWLIGQLDVCFIQIFDFEDEEETENGGGGASDEDIENLQRQINALKVTVTKNTSDISAIKTDITNLNNEVNALQDVQETIGDDVATAKSDISELSGQVETIDNDVTQLDARATLIENTDTQQNLDITELTGRVAALEAGGGSSGSDGVKMKRVLVKASGVVYTYRGETVIANNLWNSGYEAPYCDLLIEYDNNSVITSPPKSVIINLPVDAMKKFTPSWSGGTKYAIQDGYNGSITLSDFIYGVNDLDGCLNENYIYTLFAIIKFPGQDYAGEVGDGENGVGFYRCRIDAIYTAGDPATYTNPSITLSFVQTEYLGNEMPYNINSSPAVNTIVLSKG